MTEPLEGQMLPNAAADGPRNPSTWPDLVYWRDRALRQQELLSEQWQAMEIAQRDMAFWRDTAQRLEAQAHTLHATLGAERRALQAMQMELAAERRKLECALDLVAELAHRVAVPPPVDSTRYTMTTQPFPARALQVWR